MKRSATIVISDWLANCQVGQWTPFEAAIALKNVLQKEGYDIVLRPQDNCSCGGGDISGHDTACPYTVTRAEREVE